MTDDLRQRRVRPPIPCPDRQARVSNQPAQKAAFGAHQYRRELSVRPRRFFPDSRRPAIFHRMEDKPPESVGSFATPARPKCPAHTGTSTNLTMQRPRSAQPGTEDERWAGLSCERLWPAGNYNRQVVCEVA